ncbi:ABC transporter permease [Mucilaginibacter galii]|uniref:ABC transporter permease n=1 Tax=Mucilaginibacter galii TaxID=2005073 RepID=A0A917JB75_9SPHI|nr:ABC transporter permease [Mucilaginibacter galii]GGI51417.1 ABC transporter permease [Mucilaginibacter galii]
MLKNYIKTAWRNLWKGRVFNLLNLVGLAVAIACCTLIFLTVFYEFTYDRFHTKLDNIYQIYTVSNRAEGAEVTSSVPEPLTPALKAEYPAVKYMTRSADAGALIKYGNKELDENLHFVDEDFLKMFTFPLIEGNKNNVLSGLNNVVITQATAKALFGEEPALNKTVLLNINNVQQPFIVSGILEDISRHSSIEFDLLVRFEHYPNYAANINAWENRTHIAMIEFNNGYDPASFTSQLTPFVKKHFAPSIEILKKDGAKPNEKGDIFWLDIAPFSNNHFATNLGGVEGNPVNKTYPVSLIVIGCFILIIACINFINLSVARGFTRSREVGVRKTLGASKGQLLIQFWIETIMVCLASMVVGLLLCMALINQFKAIFKSRISLSMLLDPVTLFGIIILFLLVTAIAGFYPALMMVRYKTVAVLKGNTASTKPGKLRNTLLVVQFSLSTLLIICTIITWQQINYLQNKPLGYNKTEVLSIPVSGGLIGEKALKLMRNELKNHAEVASVTGAYMNMGRGNDGSSRSSILGFNFGDKEIRTHIQRVDYDYLKTLDIKLLEGREFNPDFAGDSTAVIINETMARQLGTKNVLGSFVPMYDSVAKVQVVGIVKDYNFRSLHEDIAPLTLTMDKHYEINYIFVKVKPGNLVASYDAIKKSWNRQYPNTEFEGSWINENTERQYLNERRLSGIFVSGAVIAIVISCIGLLAISIMIVLQRTKEIGIRKVLGSSVGGIVLLLSMDFVKLVLLASVIAFPIAWWLMNNWLQSFAYRITIQWWVFALATLLAILLAFITISFQSVKAALANPVKSLRSE